MHPTHIDYLQRALTLAEIRRGFCAPNPAVGVVVVKNQQIIATGHHWGAGHPHAEAEALQQLSAETARGATLYVTLEPCCLHGRTPPCTDLLIKMGIKTVYYGFTDPNPQVSGQGERQLRVAGIDCIHLPLPEIDAFYQSYLYWTHTHRPFVTAKLAMSLDGKTAGPQGQRTAITGAKAQEFTHQWRKRSDAILTTAKSTILDDPQLNIRLPNERHRKPVYVLDTHLTFPKNARLFHTAEKLTLFHQAQACEKNRAWLEAQGVRCVPIALKHGKIDLDQVLMRIGEDGMHDLLLEAGGQCFAAFMAGGYVQRAFIYMALKWLGEAAQSAFSGDVDFFASARAIKWQSLGEDVVCEFIVNRR